MNLHFRVWFPIAGMAIAFLILPSFAAAGTRSKTAYNVTQGVNATAVAARAGDVINFTLGYANSSPNSETLAIEDDVTDVLYAADITDLGGASLVGSTLRFPSVFVPANSRIDRQFSVKIKSLPAGTADTLLSNSFGNGIDIRLETSGKAGTVKGAFVAPPTGVSEYLPALMALFFTASLFWIKKYHLFISRLLG